MSDAAHGVGGEPTEPSTKSRATRVLGDHVRVGKRFVPPFLHAVGNLNDVRWVDRLAPDVLWIALLHDAYGLGVGAEVALASARSLRAIKPSAQGVRASDYGVLDAGECERWARGLANEQHRQLSMALRPAAALYPTFPMTPLLKPHGGDPGGMHRRLHGALRPLLDRWSREATLVQGTITYIAVVCGIVQMMQVPGGDLRAIKDYPSTEESKTAAGLARTTTSVLLRDEPGVELRWPTEFWGHGFDLQPCSWGDAP